MKKALIFDTYDDYNIRIQYIKSALERNGYETMIYFADFDHVKKQYYTKKREDVHYIHVSEYQKNLSYARIASHMKFAKACVEVAEKHTDVSLIYVMVPPNSMVKQFALYKRKHESVKIWFDVLDMWPESLPVSDKIKKLGACIFNQWAKLRNRYLNDCDLVSFECNLFRDTLKQFVDAKKQTTIYLSQDNHMIDSYDSFKEQINFLYCGSINHIIDIDKIVSILKDIMRLKKVHLDIIGDGENKDAFLQQLDIHHIPYTYHGLVYDEEKKRNIYRHCHFGFNIMKDSVYVGLTMKSLDYLSYGLPMINNIKGDSLSLVESEKIGLNVNDALIQNITSLSEEEYFMMKENVKKTFLAYFDRHCIDQQLDQNIKELED